jgi:subtilisin family serine protease
LPPPGETRFAPDELLVMFQGEASERRLRSFARRGQLEFIATRRFKLIGASVHRFRLARGGDLRRALQGAAAAPGVAWVQPDYYYRLQQEEEAKPAPVGTPAPASSPEASLAPPPASAPTLAAPGAYAGPALHLAEAHQLATGKGVRVAVIDSQIDAAHPEIEGAVADRFDAVETGGQESEPQAHGTGMAGAIVGRKKLEGAAPAAQLLAVRAFGDRGDAAQAVSLDIAAGIDWAAEKGAKIVNMSFAGPADPLLAQMVQAAAARGLILIAAAGNDGPRAAPQYPAAYREVIAVSALDDQSRLYAQAVGGPHVALAAPGVDVLAAAPRGAYDLSTGTSIACAELSGVAALLLEREPGLSAAALRARLRAAAKPVAGVAGLGAADARATLEKR